ncbi:sulfotransferase family protein [Citreicella sp. C3M06]|uniref:sulfotransferase family protein n=1 Tax=Citreicella sp. C3M06 TaxID=2841564 RepID=UPI001C091F0A|nr:sulfotransferase family protein [Citreicella sp. C3M06]MBU2963472.1 sulfotransferase family protein [Citreicella sp. C3M06]
MAKTLILHIGHYKTGTTALQVFFSQSGRFLRNKGVDYPDLWMHNAKHSAFAFSILKAAEVTGPLMFDYTDETSPRQMWGMLLDHVRRSPQDRVLISSEELMRLGQFPKAVEILKELLGQRGDIQIKVVAYLREPGAHVQSWYNQLIKMNIPVSDMETALGGEIEDVHFDYRRALQPWIDIAGKDNVILRPYRFDRNDPNALHRDFLKALDIALPVELERAQSDPNPRLDDRIAELLRLMQNLGFPRASVKAVRNQALSYLGAQDKLRAERLRGMDEIRAQSKDGLDWLAEQAGGSLPIERFAQNLPEGRSQEEIDRNILIGFVFTEFIQLRQRVQNFGIPDLAKRIEALEAQLLKKEDS